MIDGYLPTVPHTAFVLTCSHVNREVGPRPRIAVKIRLTIATLSFSVPLPPVLLRCNELCTHPKAERECLECGATVKLCAGHAEPADILWVVTREEAWAAMLGDPIATPPSPLLAWYKVSALGRDGWKVICRQCQVNFARLALPI